MELVYKKRKVKNLKPFKKNYREITAEAINAVAKSIQTYGYNVPIIVDSNGVIIAGHVRQKALLQLGIEEVVCVVVKENDEETKDKIRLLDNAIGEASDWDEKSLGKELRMIKDLAGEGTWDNFASMWGDTKDALDKHLQTSLGGGIREVNDKDLKKAEQREHDKFQQVKEDNRDKKVLCPECGYEFLIRVHDKDEKRS